MEFKVAGATSPVNSQEGVSWGNPWVIVGFLWVTFLLNFVDRQLIFSIFPVLRRDLGFSDTQLGLIGSLFIWTYVVCMPFAGRLTDVFPLHRLILCSISLWSLATLGTGLSHSAAAILFWRCMMGVTESLYMPSAVKLIAIAHSSATRGRALSVHGTAQVLGIVLGGWYGGWMADHGIWRIGFFSLAAAGVAYAFILVRVFRSLPRPAAEAPVYPIAATKCRRRRWSVLSIGRYGGNPHYAAPEQDRGGGVAQSRAQRCEAPQADAAQDQPV
jgi:MFS family permease